MVRMITLDPDTRRSINALNDLGTFDEFGLSPHTGGKPAPKGKNPFNRFRFGNKKARPIRVHGVV